MVPLATRLEFYLRSALCVAGFLLVSLVFCVVSLIFWGNPYTASWYGRVVHRVAMATLGLGVTVHGREHLAAQPCIYAVNHQSNLDALFLGTLYPPRTVIIAKREIVFFPVFGLLFLATRNIRIDRSDRSQSIAGLDRAVAALRREGRSIWIFPEGTRNRSGEPLGPFKKGAFHMALAANVPVVPIVLSPIREHFDPAARRIVHGRLDLRVLAPIRPGASDTPDALRDRVRHAMLTGLTALA